MTATVRDGQGRMEELVRVLRDYDPIELYFQAAEIAGEQTYLRDGVSAGEDDVVLDMGANVGVAAATLYPGAAAMSGLYADPDRDRALVRTALLNAGFSGELDVLAGIDPDDWPKIRQVAIEVHDEGGRGTAIAAMVAERGFQVAIDQDERMRGTAVRMVYATRKPTRRDQPTD